MIEFPKPKLVISKRLGFEAYRFDREVPRASLSSSLKVDFLPKCPSLLAVEGSGKGWR